MAEATHGNNDKTFRRLCLLAILYSSLLLLLVPDGLSQEVMDSSHQQQPAATSTQQFFPVWVHNNGNNDKAQQLDQLQQTAAADSPVDGRRLFGHSRPALQPPHAAANAQNGPLLWPLLMMPQQWTATHSQAVEWPNTAGFGLSPAAGWRMPVDASRKGLSRLPPESSEADEEEEIVDSEEAAQPQLSPDMNRHSVATNMERYMPLLANKHNNNIKARPPAKATTNGRNGTAGGGGKAGRTSGGAAGHHLVDSHELSPPPPPFPPPHWRGAPEAEEEDNESLEAATGPEAGPCVTANCRTWITITIPSELVGLPPGIGGNVNLGGGGTAPLPQQKPDSQRQTGGGQKQGGDGQPSQPVKPPSLGAKPMPPFPPRPMPGQGVARTRGQPAPKNRPSQQTSSTAPAPQTTMTPPITTGLPPDFVFSTKWILPVNGLSVRPTAATTAPPPAVQQITTATPTSGGNGGAGNPWARPFTMRPRPKVPPPVTITSSSSTLGPAPQPRERPSAKARPSAGNKPWTHTGASSSGGQSMAKARPVPAGERAAGGPGRPPPTPDSTIEQAAIWASTELIDAIREALAKFRATLNRQQRQTSRDEEDMAGGDGELSLDQAEHQLRAQLQAAWDSLRGTWLEQAVAELAQQADALGSGHQQKMADMAARDTRAALPSAAAGGGRTTDNTWQQQQPGNGQRRRLGDGGGGGR